MFVLAFVLTAPSVLGAAGLVRNFCDGLVMDIYRASFRERFARQQFHGMRFRFVLDGSSRMRFGFYCSGMRRRLMRVVVVVIFKIFENVTDVQKGVAIQTDVDESRLHSGKD